MIAEVALAVFALVVLPAAVYLSSYTPYFADGHTLAHFRELQSQMWHFNTTISAPHSYASAAPTWRLNYRPVCYSIIDKDELWRVMYAIGNPFLWWTAALALVAAPILAVWRRMTLPLVPAGLVAVLYLPWFATSRTSFLFYMLPLAPLIAVLFVAARPRRTASSGAATSAAALAPAVLVAILYLPWFATTRTSFIWYMTPVAPLMAVLLAAVLWVLEGGRWDAPKRVWPRPALVTAAGAATVTALFWWPIARRAAFVFWELPGRAGPGTATAVTATAIGVAVFAAAAVLVSKRLERIRELAVWATVGVVCGIVVPFLPILMGTPISPDDFYRLIWLPSWI